MNRLNSAQKTIFITDSNKRMSDALEEFEKDGKLSNYNTDGVSTQLLVFGKRPLLGVLYSSLNMKLIEYFLGN